MEVLQHACCTLGKFKCDFAFVSYAYKGETGEKDATTAWMKQHKNGQHKKNKTVSRINKRDNEYRRIEVMFSSKHSVCLISVFQGLGHQRDFQYFDKNFQIQAKISDAAGF